MRDCILDLCRQFAEGTAVFLDIEQRVVAEAACAVVLAEQCALAFTAHGERFAVREHTRDRAHKPAGTVFLILHIFQQKGIAVLVRTLAVARGVDTGSTVERIHAQAAVVRESGQTGELCGGFCLDERVFLEGFAVFLGFGGTLRQRDDFNAEAAHDSGQLCQLFLVMGSKYKLHYRLSPITLACLRHSVRQPRLPRPSSFRSSVSVNGRPSPVPCTSMNSPLEVITTLQSTMAWLSSA